MSSLTFDLDNKPGPVVRCRPPLFFPHGKLRTAQRSCWFLLILKHPFVEATHQLRCRLVFDIPKTCDNSGRACIHETSGESYETLSFDLSTKSCAAPG